VAATGSTYVIGAIETETSAATGQDNTDVSSTLKDWESYVNSHGGINGHKVQVDLEEDGANPAKSLSEFQQLASEHVLAIVDGTELDSSWAADAAKDNIPVLCGEMVADDFTCSASPDFFPAGGSVLPELYGDFAAAKSAGATSVGTLYCVEIAACKESLPIYAGYTKALGLKEAAPLAASETAPSYTAQCLVLSGEKVQAVFPAGPPSDKVAGDCAQQGYKPIWIEASGTWHNSFLTDSNLNGAVGTVSDIPWTVDNTPATEAFHAALGNLISTSYSPYNLITTWAAGLLFQAAAANAGNNPTGQSIISGLYALQGNTLGGFAPPLTFTQGKPHSVPYFFDIAIKNGQWFAPFGGTPQQVPSAISAAS
jgi:branched-chain amino acid transport system substrate-binding protein